MQDEIYSDRKKGRKEHNMRLNKGFKKLVKANGGGTIV